MSLLDDIKKQPEEVKEIMFYLSVSITVLAVGAVWFRSFQNNIYVALNPEVADQRALAAEQAPSLFGYIGESFGNIGSFVGGFINWGDKGDSGSEIVTPTPQNPSGQVYKLPLSDYK